MKINFKNVYVNELPNHVQAVIRKDLLITLHDMGINGNELKDMATIGMHGKVLDLEDTLDISKYIN